MPDDLTILASVVRAATNNSPDQINRKGDTVHLGAEAKGVILVFDITIVPAIDTVQLIIQGKDELSGKYYDLWVDAAQVAVTTRVVIIYPAAMTAADGIDAVREYPIPRTWRVRIVHVGTGDFTYSVGASYVM